MQILKILVLLAIMWKGVDYEPQNKVDSLRNCLQEQDGYQGLEIYEQLTEILDVPAEERLELTKRYFDLASEHKMVYHQAVASMNAGTAYENLAEFPKALEKLSLAEDLFSKLGDLDGQADVLYRIGVVHFFMQQYDLSLSFFQQALDIRLEQGDEQLILPLQLAFGNIHGVLGNFDESMSFFQQALLVAEKSQNLKVCSQLYNNIANIHFARGEMSLVLGFREKALAMDEKIGDPWEIALKKYNLAEYYLATERPDEALPYIQESMETALELDNKGLVDDNLDFLSSYYELKADWEKALKYRKQYAESIRETFSEDLSTQISEWQVLYESEKKTREAQTIKLELEQVQKRQIVLIFSISATLLLLLFIGVLFYRSKKIKRQLATKVSQKTLALRRKNEEFMMTIQELDKARKQAEESDRLKSMFLANLNHEIRTPLNSILGFMDLLNDPDIDFSEQQRYVDIVTSSGHRLLTTLSNMIEISKIEAGGVHLVKEKLVLEPLLHDLGLEVADLVDKKKLQFRVEVDDFCSQHEIETDSALLKAALKQLIDNALRCTSSGYIKIGAFRDNGELALFVEDTGTGVPEGLRNNLFSRSMGEKTNEQIGKAGLGVGLLITKHYIELLQGAIHLDEDYRGGTRMKITFPCSSRTEVI